MSKLNNKKINKYISKIMEDYWDHSEAMIKWVGSSKKNQYKVICSAFRIARPIIKAPKDVAGAHIDIHYGGVVRNNPKGQAILFHPNLMHGGSYNYSLKTRVSLDIRIFNQYEFKR